MEMGEVTLDTGSAKRIALGGVAMGSAPIRTRGGWVCYGDARREQSGAVGEPA